ncbi:MAG: HAMP domain-containing histidine kinase [Lachnospiraceae bacterium]|nr:HAMP domain-containing histidine kinase [Lachnospiraceae bacterium]
MIRYILSCMTILLVLLGGYFLAWFICEYFFVWYADDPVYGMLKALQTLSPFLIALVFLIGVPVSAYFAIRKTLQYLDDVIDVAMNLSHPTEESIVLPGELSDVQNELNLAREQALRNIAAANDAIQRKNDLIMYLAHDLKTPLASVIGYLTLLHDEKEISDELREKYLGITLGKAERLEDLINEFFEIARFNLSNITLQYSKINLTRMLEQTVYEFAPMLQEKNLTCELDIGENTMLNCDAEKLQRVFDNILRNAVLYSYRDSSIHIAMEWQEKTVVLKFTNHGDTISQEKLNRIFEQFYRLDAARGTDIGGAGLGLAIAKQIVELHGGTIAANSENELVEFTVELPVS